jgi:hypothetical protein
VAHHRYIVSIDVTVAQVPEPPAGAPPVPAIGDELGVDLSSKVHPLRLKKGSNQKDYEIKGVAVTKVVTVP